MSLHKLSAGDGYTYLTRQVAAADATERGYSSLGDYYSAKGEAPGVWMGAGLDSLGVSGAVTEAQMKNLFGQGIHPDAEKITAAGVAAGLERPGGRRGRETGRQVPGVRDQPGLARRAGRRLPGVEHRPRPGARRGHPRRGPATGPHRGRQPAVRATARPRPGQFGGAVRVHLAAVPPGADRGGRLRRHVLPRQVGVHPVGGRTGRGVRADRGRPPGRRRQDRDLDREGSRLHPGRAPRRRRRCRPAGW